MKTLQGLVCICRSWLYSHGIFEILLKGHCHILVRRLIVQILLNLFKKEHELLVLDLRLSMRLKVGVTLIRILSLSVVLSWRVLLPF